MRMDYLYIEPSERRPGLFDVVSDFLDAREVVFTANLIRCREYLSAVEEEGSDHYTAGRQVPQAA